VGPPNGIKAWLAMDIRVPDPIGAFDFIFTDKLKMGMKKSCSYPLLETQRLILIYKHVSRLTSKF
jgi:hypothetical protein